MVEHNGILLSIPGLIIWWNTVQHTPKTPGLILSQYSVVEHSAEDPKYTWSHNLSVFCGGTHCRVLQIHLVSVFCGGPQCRGPQNAPCLTISRYSVVEHSAENPKMHLISQSLSILWWSTVQHTPNTPGLTIC